MSACCHASQRLAWRAATSGGCVRASNEKKPEKPTSRTRRSSAARYAGAELLVVAKSLSLRRCSGVRYTDPARTPPPKPMPTDARDTAEDTEDDKVTPMPRMAAE